MIDATSFEIIEIVSPYGKTIRCATQANVLIPITKISIFGLGQIQFLAQIELSKLRYERSGNQREFSKNKEKIKRLAYLERLAYNYQNLEQCIGESINLQDSLHANLGR